MVYLFNLGTFHNGSGNRSLLLNGIGLESFMPRIEALEKSYSKSPTLLLIKLHFCFICQHIKAFHFGFHLSPTGAFVSLFFRVLQMMAIKSIVVDQLARMIE